MFTISAVLMEMFKLIKKSNDEEALRNVEKFTKSFVIDSSVETLAYVIPKIIKICKDDDDISGYFHDFSENKFYLISYKDEEILKEMYLDEFEDIEDIESYSCTKKGDGKLHVSMYGRVGDKTLERDLKDLKEIAIPSLVYNINKISTEFEEEYGYYLHVFEVTGSPENLDVITEYIRSKNILDFSV